MAVSPVGIFFIILVVLLVVAAVSWVVFTQLRARRLGLPSPSLSSYLPFVRSSNQSQYGAPQSRSGGIRSWIGDRFESTKNTRSAAGAYEQPSANASRRGFGALDPDEAWDARVGNESYGVGPGTYFPEEQELEDRGRNPYMGSGYQMNLAVEEGADRGRSQNPRSGALTNPFDDAAEPSNISLRGVSPRPMIDTRRSAGAGGGGGPTHESPTSNAERRSVFREDV